MDAILVERGILKQLPFSQWIKLDKTKPLNLIPQKTFDVRVNGRWVHGSQDELETDIYPVMLIDNDTYETIFCTKIIFRQGSYTHVESKYGKNTVRMRTTGNVTIY